MVYGYETEEMSDGSYKVDGGQFFKLMDEGFYEVKEGKLFRLVGADICSAPILDNSLTNNVIQPIPDKEVVVDKVIENKVEVINNDPTDIKVEVVPPIENKPPVINTLAPPVNAPPAIVAKTSSGGEVTYVTVSGVGYFTFGQLFKKGDVPANNDVVISVGGLPLTVQVNKKAFYADGSLKHAIISGELTNPTNDKLSITTGPAMPVNQLLGTAPNNVKGEVKIVENGIEYTATISNSKLVKQWLSGTIVNEQILKAPLVTANGVEHTYLSARFNVRTYSKSTRISVIVENNWAYGEDSTNVTYDLNVSINDDLVLSKKELTHYHHARWRRVFWDGLVTEVNVNYDRDYLIATKAIPNYDLNYGITDSKLEGMKKSWSENGNSDLMQVGTAKKHMPGTGGRDDYGILPAWTVHYIVSQDERAKKVMLGNAEQAGTWSIHYRDQKTDLPMSIDDYAYAGLYGNAGDKVNRTTKVSEEFPPCVDCYDGKTWVEKTYNSSGVADMAHQPSLSYVPYMLTGDYYHLEEQLFWATYNFVQFNPWYRGLDEGLIYKTQTRAQAWTLRTMGQTIFIMPDNHPMKSYFKEKLDNNRDWYQANYVDNSENFEWANDIGWIGYSWNGKDKDGVYHGLVSSWMNDFVTASMGHLIDLGFSDWSSVMNWHGKYVVGRLYGTDYCGTVAAPYNSVVGDDKIKPFYGWNDYYKATTKFEFGVDLSAYECGSVEMMTAINKSTGYKFEVGDLYVKYPGSTANYMTRMQGAISYAVDSGVENADKAWEVFINRKNVIDYTDDMKYSIVPR